MSSRAVWVIAVAAIACGTPAAPPRERVLARLPAGLMAVLAADGPALSHARTRAAIDVLRPRWPQRLGCAIDAALAADQIAIGVTPARSAVIVLETATPPAACEALSKVEDRTYIATLGSAAPRAGDAPSLLDDARFQRARSYLARAPIAVAVDVPGGVAIATASPDPLDAWLALDVQPLLVDAIEARVRREADRLAADLRTQGLAVEVSRSGSQIVARLGGDEGTRAAIDVAAVVRAALSRGRAPVAAARTFACPPIAAPVTACSPDGRFDVTSIDAAVAPLVGRIVTPVGQHGMVAGLRLARDVPALGLASGDVVLSVDGRLPASRAQLQASLRAARGTTRLTVSRGTSTSQLTLVER